MNTNDINLAKKKCPFCEKPLDDCECPTPDYNDQSGEDCLFGKARELTEPEFKQSILQEYLQLKRENEKLKKKVKILEDALEEYEPLEEDWDTSTEEWLMGEWD